MGSRWLGGGLCVWSLWEWPGIYLALWGLLQAKRQDPFELELVKGAAAGGISGLTAPGLCHRSDYLRRGVVGAGVVPRSS